MDDIFVEKTNTYTLRNTNRLTLRKANATARGIQTIRCIGSRLWLSLPRKIRVSKLATVLEAHKIF